MVAASEFNGERVAMLAAINAYAAALSEEGNVL